MMSPMLVSLDDLKAFLPVRTGISKYDAKLQTIIQASTSLIASNCRAELWSAERTEFCRTRATTRFEYDLFGSSDDGVTSSVRIQYVRLNAITVLEDPVPDVRYDPRNMEFGEDTKLTLNRHFLVDPTTRSIMLRFGTELCPRGLKVTYTGGFDMDEEGVLQDVPDDLKMAATLQSLHLWNRSNPESISTGSERNDGFKVGTPLATKGGLLPDVIALLQPYRRLGVAG